MRVALTIAGSDPSGGAGLQADLKTFARFGVYGASVVTLLTVQNTREVREVRPVEPSFAAAQLDAVLVDLPVHAMKTGALGTRAIIEVVADAIARYGPPPSIAPGAAPAGAARALVPLVVDPVARSTHGARLLDDDALDAMRRRLLPLAVLVTPNLAEAEALTGRPARTLAQMRDAAARILDLGPRAVLVKGGHSDVGHALHDRPRAVDLLQFAGGAAFEIDAPFIRTRHTHGTGCTLSAAIAAGLARGDDLERAVRRAKSWLTAAIERAPGLGAGHGPVAHDAPLPEPDL